MSTDLTPQFTLLTYEQEISLPPLFNETPGQLVGGFLAQPDQISNGKVTIQGTAQRILIGDATAPLTGIGIFLGNDGESTPGYDFRVGDPAGSYLHWDASEEKLTVIATSIQLGVKNITVSTSAGLLAAITELTATGGVIHMAPGTYSFSQSITIPSDITLDGSGATIDFGGGAFQILIQGTDAYSTGTVTVNNNSTTVTGSGTTWTSAMVGRKILLGDFWYVISARNSNTEIELETAYRSSNLSGASYVIATTVNNVNIENLIVQSSSIALIKVRYVDTINVDSVLMIEGLIGFDGDDSSFLGFFNNYVEACGTGITLDNFHFNTLWNFNVFSSTSGGGLVVNNCETNAFEIFVLQNNAGGGLIFTDVRDCGVEDFAIAETTGVGLSLTNCSDITFHDATLEVSTDDMIRITGTSGAHFYGLIVRDAGAQGIELVSGNSDIQFAVMTVDSSVSDGIKLTATSDRVSISTCSITNNGGYGVNIAASTCDDNYIVAPSFANNTSADISDSGTNTTIVKGNKSLTKIFTAGEALTDSQTVYIAISSGGQTISQLTTDGDTRGVDDGDHIGQTFTTGADDIALTSVSFRIGDGGGSFTGTCFVALYATSGGLPTGAPIATSSTINGADITSPPSDHVFTFTNATLSPSTQYAVAIDPSGLSGFGGSTELVVLNKGTASTISGGTQVKSTDDGANWTSFANDDLYCTIIIEGKVAGRVYKTDADIVATTTAWIGFSDGVASKAGPALVTISGVVDGLSGLTPGSQYYLSNTSGAIGSSAGTNSRKVGIAMTATELLIRQDNP